MVRVPALPPIGRLTRGVLPAGEQRWRWAKSAAALQRHGMVTLQ